MVFARTWEEPAAAAAATDFDLPPSVHPEVDPADQQVRVVEVVAPVAAAADMK